MSGEKRMQFQAYCGDEPYVFASYSHVDVHIVEGILRLLYSKGFRVWYDQQGEGIPLAQDWKESINRRLDGSSAFIVFLSAGIEERHEVMREIERAIDKRKIDPSYVILPVFLQRIPLQDFPEKIRKMLEQQQHIGVWNYGGITEKFAKRLVFADIWPEQVVEKHFREERGMEAEQIEEPQFSKAYIYPYADPPLCEEKIDEGTVKFHRVSPGETSPEAVYPMVMDNQWCPVWFYRDKDFLEKGFGAAKIQEKRQQLQRDGIYRGLLHSWQILVNRAFLQNSQIFLEWYRDEETEDYKAFCDFLETGVIVLVLFREHVPCEKPQYTNANWKSWKKLCLEHELFCLRLDWEDDNTNTKETNKLLGYPFHNYCITTAEDEYRMEDMGQAFLMSEDKVQCFRKCWKEVQRKAIQAREATDGKRGYSREMFYKDFVVKSDTEVVNCCLDSEKEFAGQMKQIADMRYNLNFANAFGVKLLLPNDGGPNPVLVDEMTVTGTRREITIEELLYAAGAFSTEFLNVETEIALNPELCLSQVYKMRQIPEWKEYIRTVEAASKRAEQWDVDFYDTMVVWEKYWSWMRGVRKNFPELKWKKEKGAISLIYSFGNRELIVVYRAGEKNYSFWENKAEIGNGKAELVIDYVCGDILSEETESCLLTRIRFFEGRTHETGNKAYKALLEKISKNGHWRDRVWQKNIEN